MSYFKSNVAASAGFVANSCPPCSLLTSISGGFSTLSQNFQPQENLNDIIGNSINERDFTLALQEYEQKLLKESPSASSLTLFSVNQDNTSKNICIAFKMAASQGLFQSIAQAFDGTGRIFATKGLFSESYICHEKALTLKNQQHVLDNTALATSYNNFGHLEFFKGNYQGASEYHKKALDALQGRIKTEERIIQEECDEASGLLQLSEAYYGLGLISISIGKYTEAKKYLEDALEIKVKLFSETDCQVAETYQAIGKVCYNLGAYTDALNFAKKALTIRLEAYGESDTETAKSYTDLALALLKVCRYDEAIVKAKKALDILLKSYGETHPEVARAYNALGLAYKIQGSFAEAIENHLKGIEIRMKIFGEMHESLAESYCDIANTYLMQGAYKEAEEYSIKFQTVSSKVFGIEHPMTALADAFVKATYIYLYRQDLEGVCNVEEMFADLEKIQKIQETFLGTEHMDLCLTHIVIGNAYRFTRKYPNALEYYSKALEIADKKQDLYMVAYIHRYLAFTYKVHGSPNESLYHSNKGLKIWSRLPQSARPQAFADPDFFAHVIYNFNDVESAKKYMTKSKQLMTGMKDKQWMNFARGALQTFEKRGAKNKMMHEDLF